MLDGLTSPLTRRVYSQALDQFLIWFNSEGGGTFNKAAVQRYRTELDIKGLAPSSINVRLAAIRKLATEAADNGLLAHEAAAAIHKVSGPKRTGVRRGMWLTHEEVKRLLAATDMSTLKSIRDRGVLALLIGADLRRSEIAALNHTHIQQRDGRWVILDLIGKHGRMRTVPIPGWTMAAIVDWVNASKTTSGPVFRRTRNHVASRSGISPQTVHAIVQEYAGKAGLKIAPHDLRRTFAQLAYKGNAPLEQIQLSLGHASVVTTEVYLGVRQNLVDAPCDRLGIGVAS